MKITIYSPLFDLKQGDGKLVANAVDLSEEDREKLRRDVGRDFENAFRAVLATASLFEPQVRMLAGAGLYVQVDDSPDDSALALVERAVPLSAKKPVCGKCRALVGSDGSFTLHPICGSCKSGGKKPQVRA